MNQIINAINVLDQLPQYVGIVCILLIVIGLVAAETLYRVIAGHRRLVERLTAIESRLESPNTQVQVETFPVVLGGKCTCVTHIT